FTGFEVLTSLGDECFPRITGLGDLNNDGYDEFAVACKMYTRNLTAVAQYLGDIIVFVVYGGLGDKDISLENIVDEGGDEYYLYTVELTPAGDVNGDSFDDFMVSLPFWNASAGVVFVVYGKGDRGGSVLSLNLFGEDDGFRVQGAAAGDECGHSVSAAGDLDNDGFDDVLVYARGINNETANSQGGLFVVMGTSARCEDMTISAPEFGPGSVILYTALTGTYGHWCGEAIGVGDVNGDSFGDIMVVDCNYDITAGAVLSTAHVLYGSAAGVSSVDLSAPLPVHRGYRIMGLGNEGSFTSAGDMNSDGFGDIALAIPGATNSAGVIHAGHIFVILGVEGVTRCDVSLADFNSSVGFLVEGAGEFDQIGESISGGGDFNGDGISDLLISTSNEDMGAFVLFG
ncbi:unnamed protein product, partial [Ectocarpus fasciculatus]